MLSNSTKILNIYYYVIIFIILARENKYKIIIEIVLNKFHLQESKTMKRWLNILTGLALTFIIIVGIWKSKPETLKNQPFLLDGSNGVSMKS